MPRGDALRRAPTLHHGRQLPVGELQVQQRQALSKLQSADRKVRWVQQDDLLQVSGEGFECWIHSRNLVLVEMQIKSWKHFQTNFCYLCGAKLNKETPYAHFSDPSQECYNLLFEGVDPVQYYFALETFWGWFDVKVHSSSIWFFSGYGGRFWPMGAFGQRRWWHHSGCNSSRWYLNPSI